jgi:excisionase family DNA binding protein
MQKDWLTSDEAAVLLGITAGRVNRLARSGELAYRMAGRTRLIDPLSVQRLLATTRRRPGRPLTPQSAWAALLSDLGTADWSQLTEALGMSPKQRYNLKRLIARSPAENWDGLAKARAVVHRVRVRPAYLGEILQWDGVVPSGVSATGQYGLDLVAAEEAEAYLSGQTWRLLQEEFHLDPSPSGNLVLWSPSVSEDTLSVVLDREIMPVSVVAIDLLDSGDPRSRRTALRIIDQLLEAPPSD